MKIWFYIISHRYVRHLYVRHYPSVYKLFTFPSFSPELNQNLVQSILAWMMLNLLYNMQHFEFSTDGGGRGRGGYVSHFLHGHLHFREFFFTSFCPTICTSVHPSSILPLLIFIFSPEPFGLGTNHTWTKGFYVVFCSFPRVHVDNPDSNVNRRWVMVGIVGNTS